MAARERETVVLTDLDVRTVDESELATLLEFAEAGAWFKVANNGDGTLTVYTGIARGDQYPHLDT